MPKSEITPDTFKAKLAIDRSDLESALEEQAEIMYEIGDCMARAVAARDGTKLDIEELEAKLGKAEREKAAEDDLKITEKYIADLVVRNVQMQKAQRDLLDAKLAVDQWGAIERSFQQRSYALRELVQIDLRRMALEESRAGLDRDVKSLRDATSNRVAAARKAGETTLRRR